MLTPPPPCEGGFGRQLPMPSRNRTRHAIVTVQCFRAIISSVAFLSVSLCGLSASVVHLLRHELTTETQRVHRDTETQRLKELDLTYLKNLLCLIFTWTEL